MYHGQKIAVVVPAYDEEARIGSTLCSVPAFVDHVVVVDDGSADGTVEHALAVRDRRVEVVRHAENRGVGSAVATGYGRALALECAIAVVIGADGQMDPRDMRPLVDAVAGAHADYAKGNRLAHLDTWWRMPPERLFGTLVLSLATRLATGYRTLDSQCGYTAVRAAALRRLPLRDLYPGYGYPNDLLIQLARSGARVRDVPVRAIYAPGTSKMRIPRVVGPLCRILGRGLAGRARRCLHRLRERPATA
jgi:glycosyltransferase involved in cell wall biosynthesis